MIVNVMALKNWAKVNIVSLLQNSQDAGMLVFYEKTACSDSF